MPGVRVYDSGYRGDCPPESMEQVTIMRYLRKQYPTATHIRNEGKRSYQQTRKHRAEGMTAGAADIVIPGAQTFVCELKRKDATKTRLSKDQKAYLERCAADGAFACVAYGHEQAIKAFDDWLSLSLKQPTTQ